MVNINEPNKLGAFERLPAGGGLSEVFRLGDIVDYYDGESPPREG